MRFFRGFAVVLLLVLVVVGVNELLANDPEHVKPDHVARPVADASYPLPIPSDPVPLLNYLKAKQLDEFYSVVAFRAHLDALAQVTRRASSINSANRTPQTSSAPVPSGCQYASQIAQAFGSDAAWATRIAMRESNCTAGAYNRSGASGVFQLLGHQDLVNAVCPGHADVFDPSCNIAAAKLLFDGSGKAPWGG